MLEVFRSLGGVAIRVGIAAISGGLVGCGGDNVESEDVRTGGLYAAFSVTRGAPSTEAAVAASLLVGGPASRTHVELDGADALSAAVEGFGPVDLEKQPCGGIPDCPARYFARLDVPPESVRVQIQLLRGQDDATATESWVILPEPLALRGPSPTDQPSRSRDAIELTWTSGGSGSIQLDVSGSCVIRDTREAPDTGSLLLRPGSLVTDPDASGTSCAVRFAIERVVEGTIDPAFDGGDLTGTESDALELLSVP